MTLIPGDGQTLLVDFIHYVGSFLNRLELLNGEFVTPVSLFGEIRVDASY
jgi:hypothetical protein